jgi:hypothetical protein
MMNEFKEITLRLDCEKPALSDIFINGQQVKNITAIKIEADVDGLFKIDFETYGDILSTDRLASVWIHPKCPKCGFKAPAEIRTGLDKIEP